MSQLDLFPDLATDDEIRAWARSAGWDCPKSGTIPPSVREAHAAGLTPPPEPPHQPVVHALLPNMGWACRVDILSCYCCRSHLGGIKPWSEVTCPWCHALGNAWFRWACRVMQGIDPVTRERRDTDPERRLLVGVDPEEP